MSELATIPKTFKRAVRLCGIPIKTLSLRDYHNLFFRGGLIMRKWGEEHLVKPLTDRAFNLEMVDFVYRLYQFQQQHDRGASTAELYAEVRGKKSNDGASYAFMLGLVTRKRQGRDYAYRLTEQGKRFAQGKGKVPERFLVLNKTVIAVSKASFGYQEARGRAPRSGHRPFKAKRFDEFEFEV